MMPTNVIPRVAPPKRKASQIRGQKTSVLAPNSLTDSVIELQANFHSIQKIDVRSPSYGMIARHRLFYEDRLKADKPILLPSYAFSRDIFYPLLVGRTYGNKLKNDNLMISLFMVF